MLGLYSNDSINRMQSSLQGIKNKLNTVKNNYLGQQTPQANQNQNWQPKILDTIKNAYGGNAFVVQDDSLLKGFIKPVEGFAVSSPFTRRNAVGDYNISTKDGQQWNVGVDIATPINTQLKSTAKGRVVKAEKEGDGNMKVVIDHGNNLFSQYSHLNKANVKVGDQVNQGQIVALSGNSGVTSGPHTDYMLYKIQNGKHYMIDTNSMFKK